MTFELLNIELHRHSQSYINILNIGGRNILNHYNLFYIEWDYNKKVEWLIIFGIRLI